MSSTKRPARFGPFHRRLYFAGENEKIAASAEIWGRPRSNIYAGNYPAVKAWDGPLPDGLPGTEFYTDVEPDPWGVPGSPQWSEGRPGVRTIERKQLVSIKVVITRQGPEKHESSERE